jgi:hypothetical protein
MNLSCELGTLIRWRGELLQRLSRGRGQEMGVLLFMLPLLVLLLLLEEVLLLLKTLNFQLTPLSEIILLRI